MFKNANVQHVSHSFSSQTEFSKTPKRPNETMYSIFCKVSGAKLSIFSAIFGIPNMQVYDTKVVSDLGKQRLIMRNEK